MTITIDATVSGTSSNSYSTIAELNSYFEADPFFNSTWSGLGEEIKKQWAVTATRAIDRMSFLGTRYDDDQQLEFPRDETDEHTDEGEMPDNVKNAQAEMIKFLYLRCSSTDAQPNREISEIGLGRGDLHIKFSEWKDANYDIAGGYPETIEALLDHWLSSKNIVSLIR
jgi:hypothetical protein